MTKQDTKVLRATPSFPNPPSWAGFGALIAERAYCEGDSLPLCASSNESDHGSGAVVSFGEGRVGTVALVVPVQHVDHHLRIADGAGDLDTALQEIVGGGTSQSPCAAGCSSSGR